VANDEDKPFTVNTDMMQLKDMSHQLRGSGPGGEDTVPRQVKEYVTSDNTLTGNDAWWNIPKKPVLPKGCANSAGKNPDGKKCDKDGECTSGYCKGNLFVGCLGTCTRKKKEGEGCNRLTGNDAECVHKCICGTCTNSAGKNPDGKKCDKGGECTSGYCKGGFFGFGCMGICTRKETKGNEGARCTNDAKCQHKCTCGTCTNSRGKLGNGKKCDWKSQCSSNTCGRWWQGAGCYAKCR